ncbi:thyroid receptor-interacting protein 11 isoform X1 [Papilio machaon]|uniref:thyroid receptor-interacting protein 11 isoform X1 n=2 Tax=Papilio machaon TaxID=76193 RepID=UPI001E665D04|nr:thyroid receptor-interacting protein 11 isoform X1 [Papilio machaon]
MSWLNLNESFNSLKGQITNFASEVLSENTTDDADSEETGISSSLKELEDKCNTQQLEIASLKKLNEELQATLQSERLSKKNGFREEETTWYWDPPSQSTEPIDHDVENQYKMHIRTLQEELSALKQRRNSKESEHPNEVLRLKEENDNLIKNLEDLDSQHRQAMDKLLTLKRDLQHNFEVLKKEHADLKNANEEYANEVKGLILKINERDKEIARLKQFCTDYDTLAHKYQNLERIHMLLKENAEKFQEENQDLHEEIFKLQEQVTRLEHDAELHFHAPETTNTVPKEQYEELLKQYNRLKERKNSNDLHPDEINIDDNAKVVIETLKRDIHDLKHKLAEQEIHCPDKSNTKVVKADKIMQLYNRYVNFELPIDYVGEMPSDDNLVLFKIESVFKTVNSFKKEIDMLGQLLSEKNRNISQLQTQIDDMTTENDFLTTDLQHYERELDEMKKNNDFLISEITALKNSSKLEPIIETHEDNYTKLETELADSTKMNKTFESEIKRIEKELVEVKTEKTKLQQSLNDMKQKYTSMLNELDLCKTQTSNMAELENNSNVVSNEKLVDEIDALKKKLNALTAKNEQSAIDRHILENDKVLLTKEIDDLKNSLQLRLGEIKKLEVENCNLKSNVTELMKKVKEFESKFDKPIATTEETSSTATYNKSTVDDLLSENLTLTTRIDELNGNLKTLNTSMTELLAENNTLRNDAKTQMQKIVSLEKSISETENVVKQFKMISKDVVTLKEENDRLLRLKDSLETDLFAANNKISNLEEELGKLVSDLNEKDVTIDNLRGNEETIEKLQENISSKAQEIETLNTEYKKLNEKLSKTTDNLNRNQDELSSLHVKKEEIDKQLYALNDEVNHKNSAIAMLSDRIDKLEKTNQDYKSLVEKKEKQIKELNQSLTELTEKLKTIDTTHQNDEYNKLIDQLTAIGKLSYELNQQLENKHKEITDLEHKMEQFEKAHVEYQNIVEQSQIEKASLINLINLKHNESLQYHNEIQRLNLVILEQTEKQKKLEQEMDEIVQNKTTNCSKCDNIKTTLKEKDKMIAILNENVKENEKLKLDLNNAGETIKNLTKRCEDLDSSLTNQQEIIKKLTAENAQLLEEEQNSSKELERLREHLMEMEENYTQELMTSEQKLAECQMRLQQVEEKAKHSCTVYTSNSIRANQEVETYKNQIKLLEKQREEVQAKLSDAEDTRIGSEASLANLQVVLEQFQLEKERDIAAATEKLQKKLDDMKHQNNKQKEEIALLNSKLDESLAGLQAASRLGDQVESKAAQINDLKEQVRLLQTSVAMAEQRYYNAVSNQQDKVDKNLVKNLIINYVVTGAQNVINKTQVLRILSTVLDFNQQECEKLGLVRSTTTTDSLAAEFVKFLQNESKPRPQLPIMNLAQSRSTTPTSRRSSTMGPNPIIDPGHRRNPSTGSNNVLFQNLESDAVSQGSAESEPRVVNLGHLETGVTQTRNSESAILKHVLRDM